MKRLATAAAAAALLLPLAACGNDDAVDPRADVDSTLVVYAAASLKGTFTELAKEFEAANEGVTVQLSFGGSSDLVSQISEGAPADVFASADEKNMDKLMGDDLVSGDPQDFASNTLVIVTPPDNPGDVNIHEVCERVRAVLLAEYPKGDHQTLNTVGCIGVVSYEFK